jgi:hypothetical protein
MIAADARGPARSRVLHLLRQRGAATTPHLNGPLLEHLLGTERLLRTWQCPENVALAGLAHAAYGTDGFEARLLSLEERDLLRRAGGGEVEGLVYLYASCDRRFVYPQLPGTGPVSFRDRFSGETFPASEEQLRDFADLTVANEMELCARGGADAPEWLVELFHAVEDRASAGVRRHAGEALRPRPPDLNPPRVVRA